MRQRIVATLMLTSLVSLLIASVAHAQRAAPATRQDVEALRSELDELKERTVELPTLSAAVQELSARLASLAQQLDTLERQDRAIPDTLGRLDTVDEQVRALGREIEGLRTRLGELEQPVVHAGAAGRVAQGQGLEWTTSDGGFSMLFHSYVHGRYQLEVADGGVDASTLRLRRARVDLTGHLGSRRTLYHIQVSLIDERPLLDYVVDHRIADGLILRVGQYKVPFSRDFLTSSTRHVFIERPIAVDALRYDRDVQVGVHGQVAAGRLGYYAGVGNGAGANRINPNIDLAMTVRADAVLVGERFGYGFGDVERSQAPAIMIGAGAIHDLVPMPGRIDALELENDVDNDGMIDSVRVISASADVVLRYQGVELGGELLFRREDFGTILTHPRNAALALRVGQGSTPTYAGWVAYGSYVLPEKALPWGTLVGARVSRVSLPFLGVGGRVSALPSSDEHLAVDGVVQLLDAAGFRRLGLLYTYRDASGAVPAEHRLILEGQLRL